MIDQTMGEALRFFASYEPDSERLAAEEAQKIAKVKQSLEGDTPQQWIRDQFVIEAYVGGRLEARKSPIWGNNFDQMRRHLFAHELKESGARRIMPSEFDAFA